MAESTNSFDMTPEEFEGMIAELGFDRTDPERAKFLRDEYVKRNSLAGQMQGAFEESTAVPEGRERATILPMTKPTGMTGWEAIKSGEAELAVPGLFTGATEEALGTLATGEKMRSGIKTTDEEIENAALTLGMSGLAEVPRATVRAMSSGVDMSTVSSGGAKSKRAPKNVPTFKSKGQQGGLPDPKFGTKEIKDIFEEDGQDLLDVQSFDSQFLDEEDWSINVGNEYDVERLGYARNIPLHELAQVKLGNKKVEDVINYYGTDPTPDTIAYVNSRLARLDNDPEFNDYVNSLRNNPDFDPNEALFEYALPRGLAAEFRSPIAETVSELDYPSKGIEGYQLISALEKNPSIRKAELDTVLEDIDPKARYSKEEVENIVADNTWLTYAKVLDDKSPEWSKFGSYQRQNDLLDQEQDYFELPIISYKANSEKSNFVANSQHFEEGTIAHSRASIRRDEMRGDDYLLVEELQSDLLQQGFEKPTKGLKRTLPEEAVQKTYAAREEWGLTDPADELLLQLMAEDRRYDLFLDSDTIERFIKEVGPENLTGKPGATVNDVMFPSAENLNRIEPNDLLSLYANYKAGAKADTLPSNSDAWDIYDNFQDFHWGVLNKEINYSDQPAVSAPPIKKIEESVKLNIKSLISEADRRGVDRIVIPPFERIVEKRFGFGSEAYKKAIDKSSGFYKTYVKSVNKAIKELEDEFGRENISSRLIDMNYARNNLGSISDALESRLGFTPDNGWEDYLRNDFYDDYYAFQNINDFTDQVPSGMTATEMYYIEATIRNSTDLRNYQFREYLEGTDPDFGKFLKGRIPDLPVTGTEIDIKGLRQEGYDLSRPTFAEGGLAMKKQMKAFFERGGLSDDGMDRDPVSGNEIPPGSNAVNVRDDIPAQLSEGEYVVPADVVKYFGVKFFEDLRTRAKQGLTDMEANGRIGGEPIMPEGMGSDISRQNPPAGIPMASGGMVTNQMPVQNPYQQQQTMYSTGMAVGGLTTNTESTFDPSQYSTLGGSYFNAGTGPVTIVEYIGPNGEILPIRTQGGKPLDSVPVGFKTRQQKEAEALSNTSVMAPTVATSPTRTADDYGGLADGEGSKGIDLGAMSYGDLEAAIDGIENNSTLSGMMTNALSNSGIGRMISALTGKTIAEKALDDYRAELVSRNEFLDSPQQSRARELEKDPQLGLSRGDAIAMGQGLAGPGGGADTFGEDFAAASAHAESNPTGMTTGKGLTPDDVLGNMPGDVTGGKGGSKGGGSSSGGSYGGGSYGGGSDSGMAGVR